MDEEGRVTISLSGQEALGGKGTVDTYVGTRPDAHITKFNPDILFYIPTVSLHTPFAFLVPPTSSVFSIPHLLARGARFSSHIFSTCLLFSFRFCFGFFSRPSLSPPSP